MQISPSSHAPASARRVLLLRSCGVFLAALIAISAVCRPHTLRAEEEIFDVNVLFIRSTEMMEKGEWQKALETLDRLITIFGGREGAEGKNLYGPMFGMMYYRRGYCYRNLGELDKAIAEYTISYEKFANEAGTEDDKKNPVWELAALELGACHQLKGNYQKALEWYEKFATMKPDRRSFDIAAYYLQMAFCHVKLGNLEKGRELVDQVFDGAEGARVRPDALFRGFLGLVEGWVDAGKEQRDEMERQAMDFIRKRQAMLGVPPYDKGRFQFNNRLMLAGRKAAEHGMFTLAVQLFGMMSSPSDIIEDLRSRAARLTSPPQMLLDEIAKYEQDRQSEASVEVVAQISLANTYERMNNFRPGYTIYSQLTFEFPDHPLRTEFLYGAIRCAVAVQDIPGAVYLAMKFRDEFPDHAYMAMVNSLLIESLFYAAQYEDVLEIAQRVRVNMEVGSAERDLPDFGYACSLFYLGRFVEAEDELASHMKSYPESKYREIVSFCHAVNAVRLTDWARAGERLDAFLAAYITSAYRSYALLERADTHMNLNELDGALERTSTLLQQDPDFVEMDRVMGLRGDCYMFKKDYEQAKANYTLSLDLAKRGGASRADNAARALLQLTTIAVEEGELEAVVKYYDQYMEAHRGGFYDAQMVVVSMPGLIKEGRTEEALKELEVVIVRVGGGEAGVGLEEAINSYFDFYLKEVGAKDLYARLLDFPIPEGMQMTDELEAWLLISRIRILEDPAHAEAFPLRAAEITSIYNRLRSFEKEVLAPYIAISVGLNLIERGTPDVLAEAGEFFESVIARGPATDNYGVAIMGRARLLAQSRNTAERDQALQLFDRTIEDLADQPRMVEQATLAKGRLLFDMERWKEAAAVFRHATENKDWNQDRAMVFFLLGRSYEEAGDHGNALAAYFAFFAPPHESRIDFSAEARLRAAKIQMDRNKTQEAYNALRDTLRRMHSFDGDERLRAELPYQTIANPIAEVKKLYIRLQGELGLQPNQTEELPWNLPGS